MDATDALAATDGIVVLDVRETDEWERGHSPRAVHIPLSELAARQSEIPTSRRLVCVCRSGNRSAMVVEALQRAGYDAHNLDGGMHAWVEAGGDIVATDGKPGEVA